MEATLRVLAWAGVITAAAVATAVLVGMVLPT